MKTEALIHSYCQVLGTGDDGSSPCLLVSVERIPRYKTGEPGENTVLQRYIFNVGEGTQRFCGEHGVKLNKVDKLFLTGAGAEEHAGLSGLVLTLSGLGSPVLEVFGPTGVDEVVAGLRFFAQRTYPAVTATPLPLSQAESQCSYSLGDEHLEVRCGVVDPARLAPSDGAESTTSSSSGSSSSDNDSESDDESDSSSGSGNSSGSDESDSSNDSGVAVVSTISARISCADAPGRDSNGGNGRSSRASTIRTEASAKTALDLKRAQINASASSSSSSSGSGESDSSDDSDVAVMSTKSKPISCANAPGRESNGSNGPNSRASTFRTDVVAKTALDLKPPRTKASSASSSSSSSSSGSRSDESDSSNDSDVAIVSTKSALISCADIPSRDSSGSSGRNSRASTVSTDAAAKTALYLKRAQTNISSASSSNSSSGSDESDSSHDSDVAVVSTKSTCTSCAKAPGRDSSGNSNRNSRASTVRTDAAAKTRLDLKRPRANASSASSSSSSSRSSSSSGSDESNSSENINVAVRSTQSARISCANSPGKYSNGSNGRNSRASTSRRDAAAKTALDHKHLRANASSASSSSSSSDESDSSDDRDVVVMSTKAARISCAKPPGRGSSGNNGRNLKTSTLRTDAAVKTALDLKLPRAKASSASSSNSSSSDESDSSGDSNVAVVSTKLAPFICANAPGNDTSDSNGRDSRVSNVTTDTTAKTVLERNHSKTAAPSRVDVDLTEDNKATRGTYTSTGTSTTVAGSERLKVKRGGTVASSSLNGTGWGAKECGESDIVAAENNGTKSKNPVGDKLARVGRTGIPARGPAVLYRCRVLHGAGSSFLVLSCPNIEYVRAVLKHSIVQCARREDRVLFVIHFSPEDVVEHPLYAALLEIHGKHIVVGCGRQDRELCGAGGLQHRKIAERSVQLNFVAPQAFPMHHMLRDRRAIAGTPGEDGKKLEISFAGKSCTVGQPLLKAVLLPISDRGIDIGAINPPVDIAAIREDMQERTEKAGLCDARDRIIECLAAAHRLPKMGSDGFSSKEGNLIEPPLRGDQPRSAEKCRTEASTRLGLTSSIVQASPNKRSRRSIDASPLTPSDVFTWPLPPPPPPPPLPHQSKMRNSPVVFGENSSPPPPPHIPLFSGGGLAGAEIFFLGTGCAAPSKNRGCSGVLVRVPQTGLVGACVAAVGEPLRLLIDAGEGTLGHLERQFGQEGALAEIQGLDCVWISHKHADHHTGLFRLLAKHHRAVETRRACRAARNQPAERTAALTVVAPSDVLSFLASCSRASGERISYRPTNCRSLVRPRSWCGGDGGFNLPSGKLEKREGGSRYGATALLAAMSSVPVVHCRDAYGLVFQPWRRGEKLVYSGDTRPCDRLVAAGVGAALLIHEATFDDSKQEDAISKKHSTTSEALEVGRRMRAGEVVLTHFSQRYPRVPVMEPGHDPTFCVAFDGMILNRATYAILPAAASVLSQLLGHTEEIDEDEDAENSEKIVLD